MCIKQTNTCTGVKGNAGKKIIPVFLTTFPPYILPDTLLYIVHNQILLESFSIRLN